MTAALRQLTLHDLAISPNSTKVRLALGYKRLPYEKVSVEPGDRKRLVEISGQPLAPVLTDGETVMFDSGAILRYLEANYPASPRLFGAQRETMKKIEEWELWCRTDYGQPVSLCFREFFKADGADPEALRGADQLLNERTGRIEEALAERPFLMGSEPTAADVAVAAILRLGLLPVEAESHPMLARFRGALQLKGSPRAAAWCRKMMEYDRVPGRG